MSTHVPLAWMDGRFIPYEDAHIHVRTECVTRGASVFEGVPAYWNDDDGQLYVFRLGDHMRRLAQSARIMRMTLDYPMSEIQHAMLEVLRRSDVRADVHLRPTVYFGTGANFGFRPGDIEVGAFVTANPFPRNVATQSGIRVAVSSWTRIADTAMPPRVKASANYLNSRLAHVQAIIDGYDGAIMLNHLGTVAEAPVACLMVVRDGKVSTPRVTDGILESITRASLIELVQQELHLPVEEREIDRTELYLADEVLQCGSAHEVTPVIEIDGYPVGNGEPGDVTRGLMAQYSAAARGEIQKRMGWLTPVY